MDSANVVYIFMVIVSYITAVIGLYALAIWFTNYIFKQRNKN